MRNEKKKKFYPIRKMLFFPRSFGCAFASSMGSVSAATKRVE